MPTTQSLMTQDRREGLEGNTLGARGWLGRLLRSSPIPKLCSGQRWLSSCLCSLMSHLCLLTV